MRRSRLTSCLTRFWKANGRSCRMSETYGARLPIPNPEAQHRAFERCGPFTGRENERAESREQHKPAEIHPRVRLRLGAACRRSVGRSCMRGTLAPG